MIYSTEIFKSKNHFHTRTSKKIKNTMEELSLTLPQTKVNNSEVAPLDDESWASFRTKMFALYSKLRKISMSFEDKVCFQHCCPHHPPDEDTNLFGKLFRIFLTVHHWCVENPEVAPADCFLTFLHFKVVSFTLEKYIEAVPQMCPELLETPLCKQSDARDKFPHCRATVGLKNKFKHANSDGKKFDTLECMFPVIPSGSSEVRASEKNVPYRASATDSYSFCRHAS